MCSAVRDHYLALVSLIALLFLLSRICLYWRITTGDLQLACFGNQGFLLTCQRKWRKCCGDETDWCVCRKDKSRSPGHVPGTPVSVAGSQLLGFLPSLDCPARDSVSGTTTPKPDSPCALWKGLRWSMTWSQGKGWYAALRFHTLQPQGSALPNSCPLC